MSTGEVVLFEPDPRGHRLHFVRLVASGLLDRGVTPVWVTSPSAADSPQAQTHVGDLSTELDIRVSATDVPDARTGARGRLRDLESVVARQPARVYVPFADHLAQLMAIPGAWRSKGVPVEGLMLRARFAYPRERTRDRLLQIASRRATQSGAWDRLFLLDPLGIEALGASAAVSLMPEPVEQDEPVPASEARAALGLPRDAPTVVLAGAIDERKGAIQLAEAFGAGVAPDFRLAFVGPVSADVRDRLAAVTSASQRIDVIDRQLSADEFHLAMCAGDIVAAPYLHHVGSSGIVARAARLGRPILGSDYGWVGEAIRRYRLGTTVDTRSPNAIATALTALIDTGLPSTRSERSEPYVAFNTPERFTALWMEGLDAADW